MDSFTSSLNLLLKFFGETHPRVAKSFKNIGIAYLNTHQYLLAVENFERSILIYENLKDVNNFEISSLNALINKAMSKKEKN